LNYGWKDSELKRTDELVKTKYPERRKDVFFGIDIFQRGQVAGFRTNETLAQIVKCHFSTAFFATGWVHEKMTYKEDPEMEPIEKSILINEIFIDRNDRFWNLLWKDLPTFGPTGLPFSTTFCMGSGKQKSILGKTLNSNPWFNLRNQKFQLSVPTLKEKVSHNFVESFHGGSCVSLDDVQKPIRLFTCDFACDQDLILIFAFKKDDSNKDGDVRILLRLNDDEASVLACGYKKEGKNYVKVEELSTAGDLKKIHASLPKSSDSLNLGRTSVNDWILR
jgi:endo-beta-N-acetylglucosaminidase D